jgi:tRNA A37 methylthiotransferase MiaB
VAPEVKAERCRRLAELETRLRERYFRGLLGRRLEVLVEGPAERPGRVVGTACRYAPVELAGGVEDVGRLVLATVARVTEGHIEAECAGLTSS